ncbi:Mov34/MPN/PAD-1 family protein [Sulfoacidibacillus thermotolerans]|uniref:JAB domain-containing protein n=1 Tax=Sulfoacidibacillus thermotolerans TaxID=1765684 RepID=A0A2U3DC03_SULT2|nr:Mov34/MPN/PAD-1 family protein [Sulfoacidibacillus thermotolerans]PWI58814.1 hypothetical protein BM613_01605 [Sulfoacidibacillus thermotolerans]
MGGKGDWGSFQNDWCLIIPFNVLEQIRAHVTQRLPFESGGLLFGHRRAFELVVETFLPVESALPSRTHYVGRAADAVRAILKAERTGQPVIGTVHSHPEGSGDPSHFDLERAYGYKDICHLIAFRSQGELSFSVFRYEVGLENKTNLRYEQIEWKIV